MKRAISITLTVLITLMSIPVISFAAEKIGIVILVPYGEEEGTPYKANYKIIGESEESGETNIVLTIRKRKNA